MVEALLLKAEQRAKSGTRSARRERTAGRVPGIVYGHKQEPVAISLDYHDLALELQHGHRLLEVELGGKKEKLLVKEVQHDHLGERILHVDLTRVDMDERVQIKVPVVLKGTPVGVSQDGGILEHMQDEIELECVVTGIPENIRAQVLELKVGETLTAGDLELPPGATLVTDAEAAIATVRMVVEEVEEEEEAAEEEAAEPEVIAREKAEEGEAEES